MFNYLWNFLSWLWDGINYFCFFAFLGMGVRVGWEMGSDFIYEIRVKRRKRSDDT